MLSPREQRALADTERWFAATDPRLAARLRDGTRSPGLQATRPVLFTVAVLGVLLVLLGLVTATATLFLAGPAAFATALSMRATRRRRGNADDASRSDEPLV